ncbi:MAG: type II toxin-antitoxin system VapC family toxin [Candidatus Dormibacteraceae bacterium]
MAERDYVVDASVAGRWFVNYPPHVEESRRVQADADQGRIAVIAPENLLHELTGVIDRAVFSRRLSARQGREQLERFMARAMTWFETNDLVLPAWDLSIRDGCSDYDAIYLEIARRYNSWFIHADGNLRRALNGRFPFEVWIEDYGEVKLGIDRARNRFRIICR